MNLIFEIGKFFSLSMLKMGILGILSSVVIQPLRLTYHNSCMLRLGFLIAALRRANQTYSRPFSSIVGSLTIHTQFLGINSV